MRRLPPTSCLLPGFQPRGLSRVEAATYVGISPTLFDQMVSDKRMPSPKRINTRKVWDRLKLDAAFAALPDDGEDDHVDVWSKVVA